MPVRTPVKKAVLVGVQSSLVKSLGEASGAHKDVKKLLNLLTKTYQYNRQDITLLMDSEELQPEHCQLPTEENISKAMRDLVANTQPGDHIVFAFSGHGDQDVPTEDRNERDGRDEVLMPCDCEEVVGVNPDACKYSHFIRDDDIRKIFVDQLQEGVHCTLIFDCCHSGTACDLPEVIDEDEDSDEDDEDGDEHSLTKSGAPGFTKEETLHHRHAANSKESDPNIATGSQEHGHASAKEVTSWSACSDNQLTYGGPKGGMFINAFVNILRSLDGKSITHRELLLGLRAKLKAATRRANLKQRDASSQPNECYETPRPQLGSLIPESILDKWFTF